MNIARPPDGFKVTLSPDAQQSVLLLSEKYPAFSGHWVGIKLRLKMTGHKEGEAIPGIDEKGVLALEIEGQAMRYPAIALIYRALGDKLTILAVHQLLEG
jgi:hypothetical protein